MPLVLRPSIKDFSREELEEHIAAIQVRRMALSFDYHATQMLELQGSSDRVERKFGEKNIQLGKALDALDKAYERVEKIVADMTEMKTQYDFLQNLIDEQKVQSNG